MTADPVLTTSMEDYLETMLQLFQEKKGIRVSDIAARMEVSKPSVTSALQVLAKLELVNHDPYEVISLTEKGECMARGILRRHEILRRFLRDFLTLSEPDAEATACGMEHAVSAEVVEKLAALMAAMSNCRAAKTSCLSSNRRQRG